MREIVLDTETTGLDAHKGDRLVEVGCVEVVNRFLTGRVFHRYINPDRAMNPDAFAIHGLSDAFLADKPKFAEIAEEFLNFIGDDPLVIHNASFDMGFLNMELKRSGYPALSLDRAIDTLQIARRRHPGVQNNLDALCQRYGVKNSHRTKHGALLDAELLAEVYAELTGGKQSSLLLAGSGDNPQQVDADGATIVEIAVMPVIISRPLITEDERKRHLAFVAEMGAKAIWNGYRAEPGQEPQS